MSRAALAPLPRPVTPLAGAVFADAGAVIAALAPRQPLYLLCERALRAEARRFLAGFPGEVSYAVKANPHPAVLRALAAAGIEAFDVASLGEVEALRALLPGARLHFNNPVKPREAIAEAAERHGVRSFALDDAAELDKLSALLTEPARYELSVRFKLASGAGRGYDLGSKFGAPPEEAAALLAAVARAGFRPALTFHPGSQCRDPEAFVGHIEAAAAIARRAGVRIARLNCGGGFPVPYPDAPPPPPERFFAPIARAVRAAFAGAAPRLLCEPGRALVAPAVSLLARVEHRRADGSVFLNDGIYGALMENLAMPLTLPARAWRGPRPLAGAQVPTAVFGPTCDPLDRLPRPLSLPAGLRPGDHVEIGLLGAYGSATATTFNGFAPGRYLAVERGFAG